MSDLYWIRSLSNKSSSLSLVSVLSGDSRKASIHVLVLHTGSVKQELDSSMLRVIEYAQRWDDKQSLVNYRSRYPLINTSCGRSKRSCIDVSISRNVICRKRSPRVIIDRSQRSRELISWSRQCSILCIIDANVMNSWYPTCCLLNLDRGTHNCLYIVLCVETRFHLTVRVEVPFFTNRIVF